MTRAGYVPPPSMGPGPWPVHCGKPMWFGPRGYGCWTCEVGNARAPRPVEVVEFPVVDDQFALVTDDELAA